MLKALFNVEITGDEQPLPESAVIDGVEMFATGKELAPRGFYERVKAKRVEAAMDRRIGQILRMEGK